MPTLLKKDKEKVMSKDKQLFSPQVTHPSTGKKLLNNISFIYDVLSQLKNLFPFLEMIKILEYGREVLSILFETKKEGYVKDQNIEETPII